MKLFLRIYGLTIRIAPVSAAAGLIAWLAQGMLPAIQAGLLERLFNACYAFLNDAASGDAPPIDAARNYGLIFLCVYGAIKALEFTLSITVNAGIYEKCNSVYKVKIAEKTARLPLIRMEDAQVHDLREKSKTCVSREALSGIYMFSSLFVINTISLVSLTVMLGSYHPLLIPLSLISAAPFFIAAAIRGLSFYRLKQGQTKKRRLLGYLWSLFSDKQAAREMRVMGFGGYVRDKWDALKNEVNDELWAQEKKDARSFLCCDAIKIAAYIGSIILALILALRGEISIGLFGACIAAFKSAQEAAKSLLTNLGKLPERIAFAKDFFAYLDLEEDKDSGGVELSSPGDLAVENVSFRYPNREDFAVRDANLSIKRGEKVVILGENGSGKTTLTKLLLGMYAPASGVIRCNGIPLGEIHKASLHKKVSAVAQDFARYKLTLRENIGIADVGRLGEDQKIREALTAAGAAGALESAGSDLDAAVGREFGGLEFSGGQWQKLAIARGLFRESELIILDEPTAALDPVIEKEILTGFLEIAKNKTAIIISHRVGLCRLADKIVVMKDGGIVETGTHGELIAGSGEYARLYQSQARWYV